MPGTTSFSLSDGTLVCPGDPFFITGSGRCGTTLMRRLVVERTRAVIPPENYVLASSAALLAQAGSDWSLFCRLVLDELKFYSEQWRHFGLDEDAAHGLLAAIPAECRTLANFWHAFHAIYAVRVNKASDARWGDKTPANTNHLIKIVRIFPAARFIFLVRDVFDVAWSYGSMSADDRSGEYLAGAHRWVQANHRILSFSERYPKAGLLVHYETLVRDPHREMARVLEHLAGPVFPPTALNGLEARDIISRPHLSNAMRDVADGFIGEGRANLPDDARKGIVNMAADLQVRLGYEPTGLRGWSLAQPGAEKP